LTLSRRHFGANSIGGRQAFGPPCRITLALRHQHRTCSKTERLSVSQVTSVTSMAERRTPLLPSGRNGVKSPCNRSLFSDLGRMPDESFGSQTVEKVGPRRWARDNSIWLRVDRCVTQRRPRSPLYRVRSPSFPGIRLRPAQTLTEERQRKSLASCCGYTLKWNPRARKATCLVGNFQMSNPGGRKTSRPNSRLP
jgi:hypothetical protein